jgi:hypothetical protein
LRYDNSIERQKELASINEEWNIIHAEEIEVSNDRFIVNILHQQMGRIDEEEARLFSDENASEDEIALISQ